MRPEEHTRVAWPVVPLCPKNAPARYYRSAPLPAATHQRVHIREENALGPAARVRGVMVCACVSCVGGRTGLWRSSSSGEPPCSRMPPHTLGARAWEQGMHGWGQGGGRRGPSVPVWLAGGQGGRTASGAPAGQWGACTTTCMRRAGGVLNLGAGVCGGMRLHSHPLSHVPLPPSLLLHRQRLWCGCDPGLILLHPARRCCAARLGQDVAGNAPAPPLSRVLAPSPQPT